MTAVSALAFVRQGGCIETRPQAFLRAPRTRNPASDIGLKFRGIVRRGTGGRFAHLGPHEFHRVEFGGAGRKPIHVKSGMACQKLGDHFAFMNRMLIPDHNHCAAHLAQQLLQKQHDFVPRQGTPMRLQMQLDLAGGGRQTPRPDQIQALVMFDARAQDRRLPTPCPRTFERRNHRKAAFIGKNQGGLAFTPLFLSVARRNVSNVESRPRRVPAVAAAVSANSSPSVARAATRRWIHSARRTIPR